MVVDNLKKIETVELFWIEEKQKVVELDSPAPGADETIARKWSVYEFFQSDEQAREYLNGLSRDYQQRGGLRLNSESNLVGQVSHRYANSYAISHKIENKLFKLDDLPENARELLENPQRNVVLDERYSYPSLSALEEGSEPSNFELL